MGSSDSDNDRRRRGKKPRRSRSKSGSNESGKLRSRGNRRDRRRSASNERKKRDRSGSRERSHRSRSRSRDRKKTSHSHRRSRSRSSGRDSSSRSRRHSKSRRARSRSHSRHRASVKKSQSRESSDESSSSSDSEPDHKNTKSLRDNDPCKAIPGFLDMTPKAQADIRMQLALKAAADADEKLRRQGALFQATSSSGGMTGEEQARRLAAIAGVDADDFLPQQFRSSKSERASKSSNGALSHSHESAIFGRLNAASITIPPSESTAALISLDNEVILHPKLCEPADVKMARWLQKLDAMYKGMETARSY